MVTYSHSNKRTVFLQLLSNYVEDLNHSGLIGFWAYYIVPIFGGFLFLTVLSVEIKTKKKIESEDLI